MTGSAAMLLWYDIVPEQVTEHDEWHTREHFPERVGIPGFLCAQRLLGGHRRLHRGGERARVREPAALRDARQAVLAQPLHQRAAVRRIGVEPDGEHLGADAAA